MVVRTPIQLRILFLVAAASLPSAAGAQGWTEAQVVAHARESAPALLLVRSESGLAEAARESAGLWPNPSIAWSRQHVLEGAQASQDLLQIDIPIVLSGRLSAERDLARSASHFARARAEHTEREAIVAVLDQFYAALAAQQRAELRQSSVAELEEAQRVIARRAEAGSVPGTELARLTLEVELARSRLSSDLSDARTARIELAAAVGSDSVPVRLEGTLTTDAPEASAALLERAFSAHAALLEASHAERAAREASSAADLAWIPDITLTGGVDFEGDPTLRTGYIAGIRMDLPFGNNGQGLRAEARARRDLSAALRDSLGAVIRARIEGAHARLDAARAELVRFDAATGESAAILNRGTRSAYTEGRASLYELLDAQRASYEVALRSLELALEAKRAEVVLRATAGDL